MEESGEKLDRTLLRAEVEQDVRAEYAERALLQSNEERDKRMVALLISFTVIVSLLLPLAAVVLGFSWRILKWAAGG